MNRVMQSAALGIVMLLSPTAAWAQANAMPTVSANGSAQVTVAATKLRVSTEIAGTGKDLKAALEALAKRRDAVKAGLDALKPAEIKVGNTVIGSAAEGEEDAEQAQYRRIMAMQRGRNDAPASKEVKVSALVKATFDLSKAEGDAALVAGKELEDKVRAVLKADAKELSAEEKEKLEEMQAMMQAAAGGDGVTFTYVGAVEEKEIAKAATDALNRAKEQATLLATAAGLKIAGISSLASSSDSEMTRYMNAMMRAQAGASPTGGPREAVGTGPGMVSLSVTVAATFTMMP